MHIRPTHKELANKLREAKKWVSEEKVYIVNVDAVACDTLELECLIETDLLDDLSDLMEDATPDDYSGQSPPEKSYEQKIRNLELFAFRSVNRASGNDVYFKFALSEEGLYLVSLHQNRVMDRKTHGN